MAGRRKGNRRDFITGRAAADALADAAGRALPEAAPAGRDRRPSAEAYLLRIARRAMACEFELCFNAGQYEQATQLAIEALDLVESLEARLSVFREQSEVCRLNRTAGQEPVVVEPELYELLCLGMRLYEESEGAFDFTAGPLSEVWGFTRRAGRLPSDEELAEALGRVGSDLVELDERQKTIRFRRPGLQLNLGSIGKGYALDRCAELLSGAGIEDFLVHGGNSSVLARGSRGRTQPGSAPEARGWVVGIRHPLRPQRRLAEIRLDGRALATSGSRAQSFMYRGRRYGHILDPRSGRPAEGVLSATAIAPSAALADGLSTAFYVMGPQKVKEYCRPRPELAAVLICPVRHGGGIEIQTAGLAESEMVLLEPAGR